MQEELGDVVLALATLQPQDSFMHSSMNQEFTSLLTTCNNMDTFQLEENIPCVNIMELILGGLFNHI